MTGALRNGLRGQWMTIKPVSICVAALFTINAVASVAQVDSRRPPSPTVLPGGPVGSQPRPGGPLPGETVPSGPIAPLGEGIVVPPRLEREAEVNKTRPECARTCARTCTRIGFRVGLEVGDRHRAGVHIADAGVRHEHRRVQAFSSSFDVCGA